jgi:uncharacterized protein Yka (UPF0111/DUF47 family)
MLSRLMPREGNFFELFNNHAERIVEGSRELAVMITTFTEVETHARHIDEAERAADKITHEAITLLHKTFITPFDREQIHQLITRMDDILDLMQDVAESIVSATTSASTPSPPAGRDLPDAASACTAVSLRTSRMPRRSSRPARKSTGWNPTRTA